MKNHCWRTATTGGSFALALLVGCLDRPIEPIEPRTTTTIVERIRQSAIDKIDILIAIDNSQSMRDKQLILAAAIPDLVAKLLNPDCVRKDSADSNVLIRQSPPPKGPTEECAPGQGFKREFPPVVDVNVGIISSSLGALGAAQCLTSSPSNNPSDSRNPSNNDNGHLIWRTNPDAKATNNTPGITYQEKGFLSWDPTGEKRMPKGEGDLAALEKDLASLVTGTGQVGCGYEMPLEAIYRFLIDPAPYATLEQQPGDIPSNVRSGVDQTILTQRKDFLRSDSLLAVIVLSDENDCSVQAEGQNWALLRPQPWFSPSSACQTNPADRCCYSCGQTTPPSGCPADPVCASAQALAKDPDNLKCADHKRRYGVSLLYPVQRYVNAFTQGTINPAATDLALDPKGNQPALQNPLYTDLSGTGLPVRDPGLVFVAGIVGLPWQAAAKNPSDLSEGFKNHEELTKSGFWAKYVGNPDQAKYPSEPIMLESVVKRAGVPDGNPFNGNERTISTEDDLQYACRFPIEPKPGGADCTSNTAGDNPLCQGTTQVYAKAYPGTRVLSVLQGIGGQGIVASVCPANADDPSAQDYGYRPAVQTIVDRLKEKLAGQCLPRKLKPNDVGEIPCIVLAAQAGPQQDCASIPGRRPVDAAHISATVTAANDPLAPKDESGNPLWTSFCEVTQLEGDERLACQTESDDVIEPKNDIHGWCYVDPQSEPGDPASLVSDCPENEKRKLRFVHGGQAKSAETFHITCSGDTEQ